jgi:catechol 2,3-dioxygenase-like lactoylglutathione lyase family enzyme
MMAGIKGIHHVALSVPDLEVAKSFYCDVLGFELADRYDFHRDDQVDRVLELKGASAKSMMVKAGNIYLEVFEFSHPSPATQDARPVCDHGYTHIALEVDDIEAVYDKLAAAGVRWHCPIQEVKDDAVWFKSTYGRDAFGNVIEIQQHNRPCEWDVHHLERWR